VTLRLLPTPCCRAFVAGKGDVRTLKTLAHEARSELRLSSTVIYEEKAAATIARRWREILGERGRTLPSVLDPDGEALLVGEMQGLEQVIEDQLHRLAGAERIGGASLALLEEDLARIPKRLLQAAAGKLDNGGLIVHLSYDGAATEAPPAGSFLYRSLYPERINAVMPIRRGGDNSGPLEVIKANPSLRDFLSGLVGSLRRERVYILEREGDTLRRIRIPEADLLCLAGGKDATERVERAKTMSALDDKVFGVFDPESIMIL
jgi:hypothetical protein